MQRLLQMGNIKSRILLRFIILSLVSMTFLLYRFFYKLYTTQCLHDEWHQFTAQLNSGLDKDGRDNAFIGIGQVIMDFWIVTIAVFWMIKVKNCRIVFSAGFFFLMRTIMLEVMGFPFPEHVVWHSPGFFSLTVPYDPTRDFYFSGHTGSLTVITLQFYSLGYKWFTLIPIVSLIYMMNMLLITRVHYTIDVAGGLVFGYFIFALVQKYIYYLDWLLTLPYLIGKKAIEKYRQSKPRKAGNSDSLEEKILQY